MISNAQDKPFQGVGLPEPQKKLSPLERTLLKEIVLDPDDKVLDANVGEGLIAEALRRITQCEVCGVSDRVEDVRAARRRLQSCDIIYAALGDIPWTSESFNAVVCKLRVGDPELLRRMLEEMRRVLCEGGQLLLGFTYLPVALRKVSHVFTDEDEPYVSRRLIEELLSELGFERLTWQRAGISGWVAACWKQKASVQAIKEGCQ